MKFSKFALYLMALTLSLCASGCSSGVFDSDFNYAIIRGSSYAATSSMSSYLQDAQLSGAENTNSASSDVSENGFIATLSENSEGVIIKKYNGSDTDLYIPDSIGGKRVTGIDTLAFNSKVERVFIPASVESIHTFAFSNARSLCEINVDKKNGHYTSQNGILFNKELSAVVRCPMGYQGDVTLPDGTAEISTYAFSGCTRIKNVLLPEGIKGIGESAFFKCESLVSLTLPRSVETLEQNVFIGCTSLRAVYADKTTAEHLGENRVPPYCKIYLY